MKSGVSLKTHASDMWHRRQDITGHTFHVISSGKNRKSLPKGMKGTVVFKSTLKYTIQWDVRQCLSLLLCTMRFKCLFSYFIPHLWDKDKEYFVLDAMVGELIIQHVKKPLRMA